MAFRYAKVTLVEKPQTGSKTMILQITAESDVFLSGVEIDKYGDEIVRPKADVTKHIISKDLIVKRVPMVMNLTYGWLEKKS